MRKSSDQHAWRVRVENEAFSVFITALYRSFFSCCGHLRHAGNAPDGRGAIVLTRASLPDAAKLNRDLLSSLSDKKRLQKEWFN